MKTNSKATVWHALIPIVVLIGSLYVGLVIYETDAHIPILFATIVASIVGVTLGSKWEDLEKGAIESIQASMQAILILMIVGTVVGTWVLSGTVPVMIYYGLEIISPKIFLVATAIIAAIVSLATGSSWTTAATVGVALMGVGQGLGMPPAAVAGAIISGAYFGDKISPLSDTTNLAPAMAGSNLFEHIKYMFYTTIPSFIIALILYAVIGMKYAGSNLDTSNLEVIQSTISSSFNLSPLLLLPPIIVIALVIMKVPAIPGLIAGSLLGGAFAAIFQGADLGAIIGAAHYGFKSETGVEMVDSLLSRGGLDGMLWTVSLIILAMVFGGIMEKTGMLGALARAVLSLAKSTGSLVLATIFTSIAINVLAADQYLSIVIPGRMYKSAYDDAGLEPRLLSRTLEDAGTLTSPLIPWNTCGAYMYKVLAVNPIHYIPFAFLNLINPVIAVIYAYTGITIVKKDKKA